jgi:CelD/BcsL family acetyltransferase involved in cellulose biosynthesis
VDLQGRHLRQARSIAFERSREGSPPRPATVAARPLETCEVFTDVEAVSAEWEELEACAVGTPYQGIAFVRAWLETIGRARRVTPFIVAARDEFGRINALLPFVVKRVGPFHVGEFAGGKDSNFNMGLFRPGVVIDRPAIVDLLRRAADLAFPRLAGYLCLNQPAAWQSIGNPMLAPGDQASPSSGYKSALGDNYSDWLNTHYSRAALKKLRKKTARLGEIGIVKHWLARDAQSAEAILDAYGEQKQARMRELGLAGSWDRAQTLAFLTRASLATSNPAPLELHALSCGDRLVAAFGGLPSADRFCGVFISYDADQEIARCSPGEILFNEVIRDLIERRFTTFDLGVGEAPYKAHCCETEEPLFDLFVANGIAGRFLGAALLGSRRGKRLIKQSPTIWKLVTGLRRLRR